MAARRLTCTAAQYHRDPCERPSLSCSAASTLVTRSPLHAWATHPKLGGIERESTDEMKFGSVVHALVLGKGDAFEELAFDDFRTNRAKDARDNAIACGRIPMLARHLERANKVAGEVSLQLARRGVVFGGESEVAIEWEEETEGGPVLCRSMIDHLIEDEALIIDLKTTGDAHPESFARSAINLGYAMQSVVYPRALEALRPDLVGRVHFLFAIVETSPPYACLVGEPAGDMRALGELRWSRAVRTWAQCLKTNTWPAYGDGIAHLGLPDWAAKLIDAEELLA